MQKLTKSEEEEELLQSQKNSIQGLDKSLEKLKDGDKKLEENKKFLFRISQLYCTGRRCEKSC